jgi:hypothetical protein
MTVISRRGPLTYIWWAVIWRSISSDIWRSISSDIWRSISSDIWRRIVLGLKKSKYLNTLGNEFLKYEAEWIVIKISRNGKSDNIALPSFYLNC